MNLKIDIEAKDQQQYVKVVGEVDAYTAPELRDKLIPLTEKKQTEITIDLSNVNYMDSTGLGVFIGALKSVRAHDGSMKIIGMTERVERLFRITGLSDVIDIDPAVRGGM